MSELGKIASKYPEKAREIITGSFNDVWLKGSMYCQSQLLKVAGVILRYGEGGQASQASRKKVDRLDFKFHFFPWYKHKKSIGWMTISIYLRTSSYFTEMLEEIHKIQLYPAQKLWYSKKWQSQREDMKREYPSTPEEAFQASRTVFIMESTWFRHE